MKTKSRNSIWFHDKLAEQLRSAMKTGKIGCATCQKELATHKNYRCYYCNIFYCPSCAKKHFQKNALKQGLIFVVNKIKKFVTWIYVKMGRALCSGYGVYPNGLECPGCADCMENHGSTKKTKTIHELGEYLLSIPNREIEKFNLSAGGYLLDCDNSHAQGIKLKRL